MNVETPETGPSRTAAAQELLDSTRFLNVAPPVAFQILALLRQVDFDGYSLIRLVQLDPELTAQLLRLVNTVYFRGSTRVSSLQEAVLRLGTIEIAREALVLTAGRLLSIQPTPYCSDPIGLWRHSVECALACRHLQRYCQGLPWDADTVFTAGLLHDLGKVVINAAPVASLSVIAEVMQEEGMAGCDAELAVLGADHAEIGGLLLEEWQVPPEVARAVRFHHAPEFESFGLANLVHVGNCCAKVHAGSRGWDDFANSLQPFALEQLRLPMGQIADCWGEVLQDMDEIERYLMK